jgi:hypothetical protein
MINTELLEQTMRHIIDNPKAHNQTVWVDDCGTTACFAGWTCLLSGYRYLGERLFSDNHGQIVHPQQLAVQLLGLTYEDAHKLFHYENTIEDLQLIVKDIINKYS